MDSISRITLDDTATEYEADPPPEYPLPGELERGSHSPPQYTPRLREKIEKFLLSFFYIIYVCGAGMELWIFAFYEAEDCGEYINTYLIINFICITAITLLRLINKSNELVCLMTTAAIIELILYVMGLIVLIMTFSNNPCRILIEFMFYYLIILTIVGLIWLFTKIINGVKGR